ncbi:poly(3-hydroxyalkanoate) depolymerase [Bordetella genomosp. 5]|uniref:extracellular catalytic domain type 1 short-chain-length polyhydroxyalkanoate depolymerase n=1 Tax=Bordetella genomosp. 5 TaxID=1395608 RepID=UPI000B9E9968|nr:PHB depolymerase family esterase [Bordetella genomosp. 5]OZI43691.1 poly(3-hydroxyalkanoate) depolymerase [Bordetella genomosp. 5]
MHPEFLQFMNHATRLTQAGDLGAATAAIQSALRGVGAQAPMAAASVRPADGDVIDVEAREVPDSGARSGARATQAAAPAAANAAAAAARDQATAADTVITGTFRNASGQRAYRLYVPPGAGDRPRPLVVMLHGCTQDANDFAAGTAMDEAARAQGFYVLYPIQPRESNPQKCWNWFKHNHQQHGRGEPSILAGMTRSVMEAHNIDARRVYTAGLSAGGAMAAILANTYPELFAAAGVHSGLAPGAASDLPSALAAMKGKGLAGAAPTGNGVPLIVFHGDRDATVHPANAKAVAATSAGASARIESGAVPAAGPRRGSTRYLYRNAAGAVIVERWEIHGAGHAWAGGSSRGSYTDQNGPDATGEMLRFFFERELDPAR